MDSTNVKIFLILTLFKYNLCSISEERCKEYSQLFLHDKIPISHYNDTDRVHKESTNFGEFPHVVALGYEVEWSNDIEWDFCVGSLISEQFVLTSATCTDKLRKNTNVLKYAKIGVHNLDDKEKNKYIQEFIITETYIYPNPINGLIMLYKTELPYDDIALLKLDSPVKFTKYARPACLYSSFNLPKNIDVTSVGWGESSPYYITQNKKQKKVNLDIFSNKDCNKVFDMKPYGVLDKLMICTGGRDVIKTTCVGDCGSPLNIYNEDKNIYEIIGVESFTEGSCQILGPTGVYTRIAPYISWIENIVWSCVETTVLPNELNTFINLAGEPPKIPPCGRKFL